MLLSIEQLSNTLSRREDGARKTFSEGDPGSRQSLSEREVLFLAVLSAAVMWITAFLLHQSTRLALDFGDNQAYIAVANAIRRWDFAHIEIQHFMGFPYFIAAVSLLFHIPTGLALWLIAALSSLLSTWLVVRLFDTVTAAYFALTNFFWLQLSFLGGSEPLSVALALGALLAFRRNRFFLAAVLGSVAVTVRPLMIFVLIGIGLVLLYRKEFRSFFVALGTGLGVGVLYILPLIHYFRDPLLTVHSYTTRDYGGGGIAGPHGRLFGYPFHGIIAGTLTYPAPWTNLLLSFFWIALVLVGVAMMFSRAFRKYATAHPNEAIFCALYLLAVFSYDYLIWARSHFMRFAIPALPFVFFALLPLLPKDRRIFYLLSVVCAVLSALSAIGIRNVV